MAVLELSTLLPARPEPAFDLSLDVDAHRASMSRSGERAVAGVTAGRMALDDTVTWAARHFGVTWRMTSRITAYDRPHRFVDEQASGPFRHWWHEHSFHWDDAAQHTVMRDVISFAAPAGPIGRLVTAAVLRRYLRRLLEQRNAYLVSALAAGPQRP